jgi:hypothetical protein
LGYWLGGKIADRRPELKILASVLFLAGGLVAVTILLKDLILSFIAQMPFGLEVKSVAAALLLFAPASVLLGFVTPYAVRLKITTLDDTGKTVGRLYALSTVGSILGTFLAGFFPDSVCRQRENALSDRREFNCVINLTRAVRFEQIKHRRFGFVRSRNRSERGKNLFFAADERFARY